MKNLIKRFLRDDKGVTAIEYGLIAGLVVLVIAASVGTIGTNLKSVLDSLGTKITTPAT
ncbi:Flp family type IVb pilin [Paraburkholderia lacunae]|uniref:Flp family type IVb pilin n=1 Tax=Paraburkholderia lacunae TaxID=2211104 RepID=A0A370ND90_9BURK|nr:Flp family type IVb pilin [Paraburkholderia lacunae]RDK03576.1 Flp family type IVb pilin [Paraburkholderia lacunae]